MSTQGSSLAAESAGRESVPRRLPRKTSEPWGVSGYRVQDTADGTGEAASFGSVDGIAIDAKGAIYVSDSGSRTIRVIR